MKAVGIHILITCSLTCHWICTSVTFNLDKPSKHKNFNNPELKVKTKKIQSFTHTTNKITKRKTYHDYITLLSCHPFNGSKELIWYHNVLQELLKCYWRIFMFIPLFCTMWVKAELYMYPWLNESIHSFYKTTLYQKISSHQHSSVCFTSQNKNFITCGKIK